VAAETVYRTKATGGDIPTAFSAIPYEGRRLFAQRVLRQRPPVALSLLAEGKTSWGTLRGYFEGDFLGTGITSNNNQSNSYVFRQRVIYAQAETNNATGPLSAANCGPWPPNTRRASPAIPGDIA
jgi:hypothetical protein